MAVDRIKELGVATRVLRGRRDFNDARSLGFAFKNVTYEAVSRLVLEHREEPVIAMYMADGWSGDVRQTKTVRIRDEATVIRKGKWRLEYLLVRGIVKKKVGDRMLGHALVYEPRGLSKGRTGWEVFQGISDVAMLLRGDGATGVVIHTFCFDGALFSCLRRYLLARSEQQYGEDGDDYGDRHDEFWAMDWTVAVRCASHAGSLAVQWGLRVQPLNLNDRADNIHIG